jgi:alkyl hydroperoxide reductase subunit AhpC
LQGNLITFLFTITLFNSSNTVLHPNKQIAAIACDAVDVDIAWIKDIEEVGSTTMNFPIFSDTDRTVCEQFGMLMVSD